MAPQIKRFKKVMVFGSFDCLHPGHLDFFKQARKFADRLVVVVARDKTIKKIKNFLPKKSEKQRILDIVKQGIADKVIAGQIRDPFNVIRREKPDVICLGYDQNSFTQNLATAFPGIKIVRLKPYKSNIYKSSKLKKAL